jgi:trehalose/maltose hydrolase-like predicted phosphorylase
MTISRRAFLKTSSAGLAISGIPLSLSTRWRAFGDSLVSHHGAHGLPVMTIQDFSKPYDHAYLSNGLIGMRPGPNPLVPARAFVSGFVCADPAFRVQVISPAPYPLGTDIRIKGISILKHPEFLHIKKQSLDMASGELTTEMIFAPETGGTLKLNIVQFASRSIPSLVCQEIFAIPSADMEIDFIPRLDHSGVPGSVYMQDAPDDTDFALVSGYLSGGSLSKLGIALSITTPGQSFQKQESFPDSMGISRTYTLKAGPSRPVRFQTVAALVTDEYHPEPALEAIRLSSWGSSFEFAELRKANSDKWSDLWQSRVKVTGDTDAQQVLDAAFFYLHSSVHRSTRTGMPPFGLSHTNYSGHSFWDTETWSLLPITLSAPLTARALLEYRLRSLGYAKRQADLYGYRGAQFPWEGAPVGGFEVTPTVAGTGWAEQHASPDVALGFWEYQLATNDQTFLREGTWPVLRAVAQWITSRVTATNRGFEILHVLGPDETVSNINNSSYMNIICKMVLDAAIRCAAMVSATPPRAWSAVRNGLVVPLDKERNIVLPFDDAARPGTSDYSTGSVDYLVLHNPPLDKTLIENTHDFEQQILQKHTGNLSNDKPVGFAVAGRAATAAFLGKATEARELFDQSWRSVWLKPFGGIQESPSQGFGCFLTDYGSLLQTTMLGFTGLRICEGNWQKYPAHLPEGWSKIEIERIYVRGESKRLVATDGKEAELLA